MFLEKDARRLYTHRAVSYTHLVRTIRIANSVKKKIYNEFQHTDKGVTHYALHRQQSADTNIQSHRSTGFPILWLRERCYKYKKQILNKDIIITQRTNCYITSLHINFESS